MCWSSRISEPGKQMPLTRCPIVAFATTRDASLQTLSRQYARKEKGTWILSRSLTLVEAAGIEPASANPTQSVLHA